MPAQGAGMPTVLTARVRARRFPPLPPGLDLLWGRRGRGQRGPKPGLSVDAIVAAAIRLADAEGLEAVSMARVAEQLGFTTMSLYRYVTSKEELLQLMWNASAQGAEELVLDRAMAGGRGCGRGRSIQREMIDRHPWITQMPMAAPPLAPNSLTFVERGLEAHGRDRPGRRGQAPGHRPDQLLHAQRSPDGPRRGPRRPRRRLRRVARPPRPGPSRRCCASSPTSRPTPGCTGSPGPSGIGDNPSGLDEQEEFLFGLDRILDGVEVLIRTAQP